MTDSHWQPPSPTKTSPTKAIVTAWLLAGTLDILVAVGQYLIATGKNPMTVFLYIATGVFGQEAFSGGAPMAALGGLFHYCIALGWTLIFFFAYPKIKILSRNIYLTGVANGLVVWLVMNRVVLPLSKVTQGPFDIGRAAIAALVIILCVGLPISVTIAKYYAQVNRT